MLFTNNIVLVDEFKSRVNSKLEIWRETLESKGFLTSRTRTKYMKWKFGKCRNKDEKAMRLNNQEIHKNDSFRYPRLIIHKDEEIKENVNHRIKVRRMK